MFGKFQGIPRVSKAGVSWFVQKLPQFILRNHKIVHLNLFSENESNFLRMLSIQYWSPIWSNKAYTYHNFENLQLQLKFGSWRQK